MVTDEERHGDTAGVVKTEVVGVVTTVKEEPVPAEDTVVIKNEPAV